MTPALATFILILLQEAPALAVKVMAIFTKKGVVTADEWAQFIADKWPDADSFFKPAPPVTPPAAT